MPDYGATQPFGSGGSAASAQNQPSNTNPNNSSTSPTGANSSETNQTGGLIGNNTNSNNTNNSNNNGAAGSGNVGAAGSGNVGAAGSGNVGAAGSGNVGAAGSGNVGAAGSGSVPTPPGDAFFFDDFEGSAVGQAPSRWGYFVAWVPNQNNPSGNASALVDDTRAVSGTHSIHFVGGQNPAQITLALPQGTNKLYVRAQVFMTRQLGQNPGANHETLIGIRKTPGQADNEIRFGEIKGVIGTNEVPSDNISPKQDQWGKGPAVAANQWHCMEVQFLGDQPQNQLLAYADGELVHSVTAPDQWNNGNLAGNWMAGKFVEVMLGWHSFSGIQTDVWMDDIVLSTSPIGCN